MSKPEFLYYFHTGDKDVLELNMHRGDHDELLDETFQAENDVEGIEAEGCDVSDDDFELDDINDVYLVVEGRRLAASRIVLCLASPVFKTMFDGFEPDKKYVELQGKKFSGVKEFYKCINPRVMEDLTEQTVYAVLPLADEYRVESLMKKCRAMIPDLVHCSMDAEGLCRHLHLAVNHDLTALESKCVALCSELKLPDMVRWMDHFNIPAVVQLKVRDRALRRREIEEDDILVITKLFDETLDKYMNKKNKTLVSISFEVLLQKELCKNHFKEILHQVNYGIFGQGQTSSSSTKSTPFSSQLFESSHFNFDCSSGSSSKEKGSAVALPNRKSPTYSSGLFGTTLQYSSTRKSEKDNQSTSCGIFGMVATTAKSEIEKNSTVTTTAQGSPLSIKSTKISGTVSTTTKANTEKSSTTTTATFTFGSPFKSSSVSSSHPGGLFGTNQTTTGSESKKQSTTPLVGTASKSGVISTTTPSGGLFGTGAISVNHSSYPLFGGKFTTSVPLQGLFGTKIVTASSETKSSTSSLFSFKPITEEIPTRSLSSPLFGIKTNAASSHTKEPNMTLLGPSANVDDIHTSMNGKDDVTLLNAIKGDATKVQRDVIENKMKELIASDDTSNHSELKDEDAYTKIPEETSVQGDKKPSGKSTAITSDLPFKTEAPRNIFKVLQGMRLLYKYLPHEKNLKVATVQYMRNKIESLTPEEKEVYNLLPTQAKLDVKGILVKEIPDRSF